MTRPLSGMEGFFKALADATRLRILGLLLTGEVCVCHIHESLRIPQSKASRHLAYPVLKTISQAVAHTLTHMDVVQRDAERLTKKTGCCLPAPGIPAAPPC